MDDPKQILELINELRSEEETSVEIFPDSQDGKVCTIRITSTFRVNGRGYKNYDLYHGATLTEALQEAVSARRLKVRNHA